MFDEMFHKISHTFFRVFDTGAISTAVAAFFGLIPDITALFALIYLIIRIYETETIKKWTNKSKKQIKQEKCDE